LLAYPDLVLIDGIRVINGTNHSALTITGTGMAFNTVQSSLDKKGGTRFHLLLSKRWTLDGIFFHLFCPTNPGLVKGKINNKGIINNNKPQNFQKFWLV
jgi:hypothetical protein